MTTLIFDWSPTIMLGLANVINGFYMPPIGNAGGNITIPY